MFGYLTADGAFLTPEELARYKACYCGLCRSLRDRHGQASRMTLNYDMSFLVLLLQSLYEPEEKSGNENCPVHPLQPRPWQRSAVSDYAADLNVALAYAKCRDNWEDDGSLSALTAAKLLRPDYEKVRTAYPRQCTAMEQSLAALARLEKENIEDPDAAAACSGAMLSELFVWREDRWSDTLRAMGDALGRALYVMDACMDLSADAFRGRYNPFRRFYGLQNNEERFRSILQMLMGDCVRAFDRLPLVQDASLLKNILCLGFWTRFDKRFLRGKKVNKDG